MRNIIENPRIYPTFLNLDINKLFTPSSYLELINIFGFQTLLKYSVRKLYFLNRADGTYIIVGRRIRPKNALTL
jgi:hypothetical protein